jgi:ABC-type multidrug transport system ATPase subunit
LGLSTDAFGWEVARLSTGERQRLALIRAFLIRPRVLLLDEPTSGLDPEAANKVENLLLERIAGGLAVLLATHDADQAARLSSRRYGIEGGVLRAIGPEGPGS